MRNSPNKAIFIGLILIVASTAGFLIFKKDNNSNSREKVKSTIIDLTGNEKKQDNKENNKQEPPKEVNLVAAGDIIMSRHVGVKIRESGDNAHPFRNVADILSAGDITFTNVEAPFLDQGELITEGMSFKAEPEFIDGLTLSGIDVASLANNHMKNQGSPGVLFTLNHLASKNIKYCGAGKNFQEAHTPVIVEKNNQKFAFLAYTYSDGIDFQTHLNKEEPDVAFWEIPQMQQDVKLAKPQADTVIVYMHAGQEYIAQPIQDQINFAHAAIDAGADLVLGSHPHWVETTEKYKDKYIIYSMGNFVFDQMWSQETKEGVIVKLKYQDKNLKQAEFIPTIIEDYNQPRVANETEKKKILDQMELKSSMVNF